MVETFKNKNVNLFNHNSNKNKLDPTVNKIIKDVSHLKFNYQIMTFSENKGILNIFILLSNNVNIY